MIQIIKIICKSCNQLYSAIIEIDRTLINGTWYDVAKFTPQIINSVCVRCQVNAENISNCFKT